MTYTGLLKYAFIAMVSGSCFSLQAASRITEFTERLTETSKQEEVAASQEPAAVAKTNTPAPCEGVQCAEVKKKEESPYDISGRKKRIAEKKVTVEQKEEFAYDMAGRKRKVEKKH